MIEQIEATLGLGRTRQHRMQMFREGLGPVRDGFDPSSIRILQSEHHPDADPLVDLHHRVEMAVLERVERQHVLDGGHSGP